MSCIPDKTCRWHSRRWDRGKSLLQRGWCISLKFLAFIDYPKPDKALWDRYKKIVTFIGRQVNRNNVDMGEKSIFPRLIFPCGIDKKVSTNENKVKGLGSPLRAEPSGRCPQTAKSVCEQLKQLC